MMNLFFKHLDVTFNSGELISIIGPNGSGKTTLLKMMCGKLKNDSILIDHHNFSFYNMEFKRNNIVCVFDDNIYNTRCVKEELEYYLHILNLDNYDIENRVNYFIDFFNLDSIIDNNFDFMSVENRIYVKILSLLIICPSFFCVDDLLSYLNKDKKVKILNYIKEKNITFLNITSDMEELFLYDKILVMNKGKKEIFDKSEIVLKKENIFKELGLSLPFIYDINNLLMSYELIKENHYNSKELVDLLWK